MYYQQKCVRSHRCIHNAELTAENESVMVRNRGHWKPRREEACFTLMFGGQSADCSFLTVSELLPHVQICIITTSSQHVCK
jgi:hypothetical protein